MNRKIKILAAVSLVMLCLTNVRADETGGKKDSELKKFKQDQTSDILDHLERGQTPSKLYKPLKLESTKSVEYQLKVERHDKGPVKCHAEVTMGYLQFDTRARVDTTIENKDCAASSGQYEVQLDIADANHTRTIEQVENWSRDNNAPVESRKYYEIGSKVELLRATVRGLTCICAPKGHEK